MRLTRWSPKRSPLSDFSRTMNSIFNTLSEEEEETSVYNFDPAIDIRENGDKFELSAELPGVDKKDVNISVNDDVLTISGEKKKEVKKEAAQCYRSERFFGKFERSFRLPDGVDQDEIEASYENGILHLDIPKTEESKPKEKQIEIK